MSISLFRTNHHGFDFTLQWAHKQLVAAGLRTVQTFDLNTARSGQHDCQCPNHGTEQCDCQMVILLVYGNSEEPISLVLHGNNDQTWLSISEDMGTNTGLAAQVRLTLDVQKTTLV